MGGRQGGKKGDGVAGEGVYRQGTARRRCEEEEGRQGNIHRIRNLIFINLFICLLRCKGIKERLGVWKGQGHREGILGVGRGVQRGQGGAGGHEYHSHRSGRS